jgi:hypothetical protein
MQVTYQGSPLDGGTEDLSNEEIPAVVTSSRPKSATKKCHPGRCRTPSKGSRRSRQSA